MRTCVSTLNYYVIYVYIVDLQIHRYVSKDMVDATNVKGLSSMLHVDVKVGRVISVLPLFNFTVLKTCVI